MLILLQNLTQKTSCGNTKTQKHFSKTKNDKKADKFYVKWKSHDNSLNNQIDTTDSDAVEKNRVY